MFTLRRLVAGSIALACSASAGCSTSPNGSNGGTGLPGSATGVQPAQNTPVQPPAAGTNPVQSNAPTGMSPVQMMQPGLGVAGTGASMMMGTGGADAGGGGKANAGHGDAGVPPDGSASGAAGAGSSANAGSPCTGGKTLLASDAPGMGTPVNGNGEVQFQLATSTQIMELKTTLIVPAKPTTSSTLFIWPGLEPLPGSANYNPIGIGVLQPVLTWGTSCAPGSSTSPKGWWISGQYVNPYTSDRAHYGCMGGNVIDVAVDDALDITMSLAGTSWNQLVVDRQTGKTSSFDVDLGGQGQDWVLFKIEIPTQTKPASDIVFTSTTLSFAAADSAACQPSRRGANDYFAAPEVSADGTKCCISRIILRAQGVPATTQNMP